MNDIIIIYRNTSEEGKMRSLKLAKIMIAAAAAVFALSVNSYAGAWLRDSNGWWYCNDDRSYTTNNWQKINGAWYYFNSWGYMETGWKQIGGSWYYFHADGKMAHDTWIDGTYYVGSDGRMLTNTTTPDGYRVGSDGRYQAGAQDNYSAYMAQRFRYESGSLSWMWFDNDYKYTFQGTPVFFFMSRSFPVDKGNYYEVANVEVCTAVPRYEGAEDANFTFNAIGVLPVLRIRKYAVTRDGETPQVLLGKYGSLFKGTEYNGCYFYSFPVTFDSEWYVTEFSAHTFG